MDESVSSRTIPVMSRIRSAASIARLTDFFSFLLPQPSPQRYAANAQTPKGISPLTEPHAITARLPSSMTRFRCFGLITANSPKNAGRKK